MLVKAMLSSDYVKFLWSLETVCPERVPTVKDDDRKKDGDKKKDSLCKLGCLYGPVSLILSPAQFFVCQP